MGIPNIKDVIISLHNDFETNDKLQDKIYDLEQQLQAYKDKEDKIRELIDNYIHDEFGELSLEDILQILNEGSDK